MAGQSIGELFVSLGFDVDDAKLKSFDDTMKSVYGNAIKLAGVAGFGFGLAEISTNAAKTAVNLRDLNAQFGIAYDSALRFSAKWSAVNPLADMGEGFGVMASLAKYHTAIMQGKAGNEFQMFGGTGEQDTPDKMLAQLRKGLPFAMAQAQGNRGMVSGWLEQITGSRNTMNYLEASDSQLSAAEKLVDLRKQEIEDMVSAAEALRNLHTEFDNFFNHVVAGIAKRLPGLTEDIKQGEYKKFLSDLGDWDPFNTQGISRAVLGPMRHLYDYGSAAQGSGMDQSRRFWTSQGYSPEQIAGWLAQEKAESGFNPGARNGKFGGSFQWSPARAKAIKDATGIDIYSANHFDQLRAANWEFSNMGLADQYRATRSPADASKFLSDKFEIHEKYNAMHGDETAYRQRMAQDIATNTTNNVTINVQSNSADAGDVADSLYERMIKTTYPTRDTGALY